MITGTLPSICHPEAMTSYLYIHKIRIFDFTKWANPLREQIRENAEKMAAQANLNIEFIRRANFRKEERIKKIIETRGHHPGLVHIFSAMEACRSYEPWHNKKTGKTYIRPDSGKCLHYYFYFIDQTLGLCYLRVPTWAPFRLQFYFNGHNLLARRLQRKGIDFKLRDNAFTHIDNFDTAQKLADNINIKQIHRILDQAAKLYCPVSKQFKEQFHWSIIQAEYATDIIFKRRQDLQPIYEELIRTAIHAVKADNIATFLGRKLHQLYEGEMGNQFSTRIEGTRIKHQMGPVAVKMYDKFGHILRIETTTNNVTFFKHHRTVEHRNGTTSFKLATMRKTIYSMAALRDLMQASNRRYLEFISAIDDPGPAQKEIEKIARPVKKNGRSYRGFNLFHGLDLDLFRAIIRGEFNISGLTNKAIRQHLPGSTPAQVSRLLKRLRKHGLVKKIGHRFKYYLTKLGRKAITASLKWREMFLIPLWRGTLN
jgi:hypothetical protein